MPCPKCGSRRRVIEVYVTESLILREKWAMKQERPGRKKPISESVMGDDLHRQSGQWNKLERTIDRENDRYTELITDPVTGNVIRSCDEPLSQHQGRGTAKRKPAKES